MELMWIIYLIEVVCSSWSGVGFILALVLIFSVAGFVMIRAIGEAETPEDFYKIPFGKIVIFSSLILFLGNFIPSKQTAYLMLGAYGVQTVAETVGKNEEVQKLGKRTLSLVETAISKYEKELSVEEPNKTVDEPKK